LRTFQVVFKPFQVVPCIAEQLKRRQVSIELKLILLSVHVFPLSIQLSHYPLNESSFDISQAGDGWAPLHLSVMPKNNNVPQSGTKPSFFIALICTNSCRIQAGASTVQGHEMGGLVLLRRATGGRRCTSRRCPERTTCSSPPSSKFGTNKTVKARCWP